MRGRILLILVLLASSVNALILSVEEGELVKVNLNAYDPEGNPLTYTFTSPLDENGEWQTQIGDAEEYNIIVTVSDGKSVTEQEFTLIVKELVEEVIEEIEEFIEEEEEIPILISEEVEEIQVNNPPKLEKIKDIKVVEGDLVKITPVVYDEDNDEIKFGFAYPLDDKGEWQTGIGDFGEYIITVTATDGQSIDSKTFKIIVKRKERDINFEKIDDITLNENEEINLELKANVEEGFIELFAENLPEGATLSGNVFHFKPDYDYVGRNIFTKMLNKIYTYVPKKSKTITFIAQSGNEEEKQKVKIIVTDVNRKPELEINDIEINEEEKIIFNPMTSDEDGDWLKIKYSGDLENNYQTNLDDAGEYKVKVTVSDPYTSISKEVKVIVKNANREPVIEELSFSKINENEELKINLDAYDPDDDELSYYIVKGPGSINGNVYSWTPGFDFVKKSTQDLITKIKYFNKKFKQSNKEIEIRLGVSDGNLTNEDAFKVVVYDINQKPEITNFEPEDYILVGKGGRIVFSVDVNDLDDDDLIYKWNFGFMDSLKAENIIARTFTKKGIKKIKVTVSDGVEEVEKEWRVKVI